MRTTTYRKSATRDVRPFFSVASLESALEGAQIRLFEGRPLSDATSFIIEEQDVAKLAVTVLPNLSDQTLADGGIRRSKLVLAVTASNPFLKQAMLVHVFSLSETAPSEVAVGNEVLERLGGGSNLSIQVALCLASELKKEPGKPFLQGHWLSKKSFDLRPPKIAEDFGVDSMDDEGWKAMGFPAKTLYHVEFYGGANDVASKDRSIAKVRIHADVYNKLAVDSLSRSNRPMLAFLAAEIPCQILAASFEEWKGAEKVEPRSPLSAFLKRIDRIQPCTLQQLRAMVEEAGMPKLRAILHADQQTVRQIAET